MFGLEGLGFLTSDEAKWLLGTPVSKVSEIAFLFWACEDFNHSTSQNTITIGVSAAALCNQKNP